MSTLVFHGRPDVLRRLAQHEAEAINRENPVPTRDLCALFDVAGFAFEECADHGERFDVPEIEVSEVDDEDELFVPRALILESPEGSYNIVTFEFIELPDPPAHTDN